MPSEPCSGFEPLVADRIEAVMPAEEMQGPRECHDAPPGRRRSGLGVSVCRAAAACARGHLDRRTSRQGGELRRTGLGERLTAAVEAAELGAWIVSVQIDADFRSLEPEILLRFSATHNRTAIVSSIRVDISSGGSTRTTNSCVFPKANGPGASPSTKDSRGSA
jgi:hypothetical protein